VVVLVRRDLITSSKAIHAEIKTFTLGTLDPWHAGYVLQKTKRFPSALAVDLIVKGHSTLAQ
jgi:hypothetical protein